MASSTIITADRVGRLGLSEAWGRALIGKTIAQACELYLEDLTIVIGAGAIDQRGMVSYTLEGQTVQTSMSEVTKVVAFLREQRRSSNGPMLLRVMLP
jgi:hypothetical protein